MKTIAINGFGRIGRTLLRCILDDPLARENITIGAINIGPACLNTLDHLFTYDTVMGTYNQAVRLEKNILHIGKIAIPIITECNPLAIDWKKYHIDWVVEATGCFTDRAGAQKHLTAGARKVLISAPAKQEDITIIPGVNDHLYNQDAHTIVSLGSCTTNCFAPIVKLIHETYTIEHGFMTTTHAYTNNQVLLDLEHKDLRRARAAAQNIIPTKTGASSLIEKLFPDLQGKLSAMAIRVPVPIVSFIDATFITKKTISKDSLNECFEHAAKTSLKNILSCCKKPLVSSDYIGNRHSAIIDTELTKVVGPLSKVCAWYDNEWGYSQRLKDFLLHN